MGKGGTGFHSSRAEFLTDDALNDSLKYSRNGGCFVTTKKMIFFVVFALISLAAVVIFMYYYGPNRRYYQYLNETVDIETLLNETVNEEVQEVELRLPDAVHPVNYRLWIHPILDEPNENNFTFTGRVKILINCTRMTNKIVLHYDDLNITEADVNIWTNHIAVLPLDPKENTENRKKRDVDDDNIIPDVTDSFDNDTESTTLPLEVNDPTTSETPVAPSKMLIMDVNFDPDNFKFTITTRVLLEPSETYIIDINFRGDIINNLVGLYKTSYTDPDGNTRWLATTYFQPVYARRVFPCFDEPSYKATFEISIARRTNMTALSNMPIKSTEPMNGTDHWVWDHFMKTPPMSTYVVAFTISDFDSLSSNLSNSSTPLYRVWAPKHELENGNYALEVVQEILPFFEEYFGMKYPLPKLDLLAIPNFGKVAMENWGIISFRKASLLFNPKSRSIKTKSLIFTTVAHELAHQWFGDLVTMEWWSDVWLNEGFGTFMAEVVLRNLRPRWQVYSSVQLRDTYKTLYLDALKSTHPIQSEIKSKTQIEQIFDTIIYQKGSSILRMLNVTLSEKIFRGGLRNYLHLYAFNCTTQNHLWRLFTTTARNESILPENVTVKELMGSWTNQSGYPLITVERNYFTNTATVNQTKMIEKLDDHESLWYVPITFISQDNAQEQIFWLQKEASLEVNFSTISNQSWVLMNIDETGFFRVNYDLYNWQMLQLQLKSDPSLIPVVSRGQLIDDAFELAGIGVVNYTVAFDLVKYLNVKEINYIPWYSAMRNLNALRVIIINYDYAGIFDDFLLKLIRPVFEHMGTKDEPYDTQNEKLLRLLGVTTACDLRYSGCISWAKGKFREWMQMADPDERNPIQVDYRFIAQCHAIKAGGLDEWDFLWNRTLSQKISPIDLQTAYLSLGCTNDPWLINRYLEYSLMGNVSLENVPSVWQSISHSVGVRTGFQFLRLNWERIFDTYEDIYLVFSTIFHDFVSQLSTEIDLEDLTTFYKLHQNDLKSVSSILQSTVDQIKLRISWRKKHLDLVLNWLRENK